MNFKVGDWVEFYDMHEKFKPFQIEEKHLAFPNEWWEFITLWSPKEGAWAWFWDDGDKNPILAQYAYFSEGYVTKAYIEKNYAGRYDYVDTFEFCEPFIGELPSMLKY